MRKLLVLLFMSMFLISLVSAQPILTKDKPVEISHPLRMEGAVDSAIEANITVRDPDNLISAVGFMSFNTETLEHNITLSDGNSSKLGVYNYCISATNGSLSSTNCFDYEVTLLGEKADTSQSLIYMFLGFLSLIIFGLSLWGAIILPWKNTRNDDGIIVGMNDLKYVKLFLWFWTYLMAIFITFSFRHVARVASWDVGGNWLNAMFWFLIVFLFPAFVFTFTTGIIAVFSDKKTYDFINRGFKVK